MTQKIKLFDTTLRDGAQREGVSLSVEDKMRIAQCLDELGVDYIEGGFIASNPKDAAFFYNFASGKHQLKHAQLVTFGLTTYKNVAASQNNSMQLLAQCPVAAVTLVGKASKEQVANALETTPDENLRMIFDSIDFLANRGKQVFFDAEHYFDGYKNDPAYVFEVLAAAIEGGAETIVLCDTNGGSLPNEVYQITKETVDTLRAAEQQIEIGIHAHDDSGCGVANTLEAVRAGATLVQGTVNGYGERVGNANLLTIIANLELKLGLEVVGSEKLRLLTSTAQLVAETFNVAPDAHNAYVGKNAFTHKGGSHVSAKTKSKRAYEHIDPALVGNFTNIVLSDLAGRTALVEKAKELGFDLAAENESGDTGDQLSDVAPNVASDISVASSNTDTTPADPDALLQLIKEREAEGYSYEVADASLALLLQSQLGEPAQYFSLESFRVISDKREDGAVATEATIKIHVGDQRFIATGEGNGPVNALDAALRKAITQFYPQIENLELRDFKVRVLDESTGTGAVTRVFIETTNGEQSWGTVGVSENIIEASWDALVDSIAYGLLKGI